MNRQYLKNACEEIDASIFSGDVLYDDLDRNCLSYYISRWVKAIKKHKKSIKESNINESEI